MHKKYYYRVYYSAYLQPSSVLTVTCDVIDYDNQNYLICKYYDDNKELKILKAIPHKYVCSVQREEEIIGDK